MTYQLTDEEKISIVTQRIKNLEYAIYNLEISLIEENAVSSPDTNTISSINSQMIEANQKKTALLAELNGLTA